MCCCSTPIWFAGCGSYAARLLLLLLIGHMCIAAVLQCGMAAVPACSHLSAGLSGYAGMAACLIFMHLQGCSADLLLDCCVYLLLAPHLSVGLGGCAGGAADCDGARVVSCEQLFAICGRGRLPCAIRAQQHGGAAGWHQAMGIRHSQLPWHSCRLFGQSGQDMAALGWAM